MEHADYKKLPAIGTDKIVYIAARCSFTIRKSIKIFFVIVTIGDTYILMTFFIIYPYQGSEITIHNTPHWLFYCLGRGIDGCVPLPKTVSSIRRKTMANIQ
jgi:hypothetical protein